jgi:hypothetical protein
VETAVAVYEGQFLEFIHEVINCDCVVPTISANVSCDFGQNPIVLSKPTISKREWASLSLVELKAWSILFHTSAPHEISAIFGRVVV